MKTSPLQQFILFLFTILLAAPPAAADDASRLAQLNGYWAEVSRTVREGDFDGYKATTHGEGVLVSGSKKTSQPLAKALERWQQDFVDTKAGKVKGNVLLRKKQYDVSEKDGESIPIAASFLLGKISNCRTVLDRAIRDHAMLIDVQAITAASASLKWAWR
jgi:hypothetical protein